MKRLSCLLLALAVLVCAAPAARGAEPVREDSVTWFPQYHSIARCYGARRMAVGNQTGAFALADLDGEPVTEFVFNSIDLAEQRAQTAALAVRQGENGILELETGAFTPIPGYESLFGLSEDGRCFCASKDGQRALLNWMGEVVAPLGVYDDIRQPQNGRIIVTEYRIKELGDFVFNRNVGVIDYEGKVIVPLEYANLEQWGDQFVFFDGIGCGVLDRDGAVIVPAQESVYPMMHGNWYILPSPETVYRAAGLDWTPESGQQAEKVWPMPVMDPATGLYGFQNEDGTLSVPYQFSAVGRFDQGYALVKKDGVFGLLKNPLDAETVSAWAAGGVDEARELGLVTPRTADYHTYYLTRLQFAELAVNLYEKAVEKDAQPAPENRFTDTDDSAARKAAGLGIVTGTWDGTTFSPDAFITREQLAVMLYRTVAAILRDGKGMGFTPVPTDLSAYADKDAVSHWAAREVSQCSAWEIMNGDGNAAFAPQEHTTVEQGILTVLRTYRTVLS